MDFIEQKFVDKIEKFALDNAMFDDCNVIIAGLSGGADSVCLVNVLARLRTKYNFILAAVHVNHQIRGEEADMDEQFVKKMCDDMDIKLVSVSYDVHKIAKEQKITVEEAGRNIRYKEFHKFALNFRQAGLLPKIAVAHNMNDNAETVLFNLFRGSSLGGMSGIKAVSDDIIRPLLTTSRDEIEKFLSKCNIPFRMDSTNLSCDYTRNVTRLKLLPIITKEINSQAIKHICDMASFAREAQSYIDGISENIFNEYVTRGTKSISVNREKLLESDMVICKNVVREMIIDVCKKQKDIENIHINSCIELMKGDTGKSINLPYGMIGETEYEIFRIRICEDKNQNANLKNEEIFIDLLELEKGEKVEILFGNKKFLFEISQKNLENTWKNDYTKCFDYDKIKCDVSLRYRRNGDYLIINEDGKRKKLKDYFIDKKISRGTRDKVVLLTASSEVLWIPGYRSSEGFHVDEDTRRILVVTCENN